MNVCEINEFFVMRKNKQELILDKRKKSLKVNVNII